MNICKSLLKKFALVALSFFMLAPSMANNIPVGMCPEQNQYLILISDYLAYESGYLFGFAHVLLTKDINGDGYACAVYRCNPCPPNAKVCNEVCTFTVPITDNDAPF